jgi:hypothetical protein
VISDSDIFISKFLALVIVPPAKNDLLTVPGEATPNLRLKGTSASRR